MLPSRLPGTVNAQRWNQGMGPSSIIQGGDGHERTDTMGTHDTMESVQGN